MGEKLIRNKKNAIKNYNVENFSRKISEAVATRVTRYTGRIYKKNEEVYIQKQDKKRWCGPVKVIYHEGSNVWVMYNGNLLKIAECRVQPVYSEEELKEKSANEEKEVTFSDAIKVNEDSTHQNESDKDKDKEEEKDKDKDKEKDRDNQDEFDKENVHSKAVENFYVKYLGNECLESIMETIFSVEIPVKRHGHPDCVEAKETELQNLLNFQQLL